MAGKAVFGMMLTLLLASMLTLPFKQVGSVHAPSSVPYTDFHDLLSASSDNLQGIVGFAYEPFDQPGLWLSLGELNPYFIDPWDDNNNFVPASGRMLISIQDVSPLSGQILTVEFDTGSLSEIYVPSTDGTAVWLYLWVADDGSTYYDKEMTLLARAPPTPTEPPVIIVVPDDYSAIQQAINHANEGDTIYVKAGTYFENVVVNKTVSLLGENTETTIIDGNENGDCVNVTANRAKISGFTIRNGGSRPSTAYASVRLLSSGNSILNNNLINSWCGIWMEPNSDYNLIANNTIMENLNGIAGQLLHNTKIIGNTIENNLMGMWIGPYSQNNVISFNNIIDHWAEGIMMMQSTSNTFEGNNIVDNNQGGYWAGITIGFQHYNSSYPSGNKFFHNNIANMGKQIGLVGSEPIIWDDGYPSGGNYWSDYNGNDFYYGPHQNLTASDGIGDTPYVIDSQNIDHFPLMHPYNLRHWDLTGPYEWVPDGKCDMKDILLAAKLYGALIDNGKYDRRADLTGPTYLVPDLTIDIRDIALIAKHYGETCS